MVKNYVHPYLGILFMNHANSFRDLVVYQKAYSLVTQIFYKTMKFPLEEKYSLTDQIRRSSRSITSNIAEAWSREKYLKVFVNKLTIALGEEYETEVWLDYSRDCKYITDELHDQLMSGYDEVRKILISISNNPDKWCL
ncbi:four helix bundle protein [Saccharicrinis carchari]|uniref:Four helix bundle protein n=1 Tax=Saccharicrinis carchari TaxID=1168039 RepID=A0A521BUV0_SACCC|nr:four helix bundle protein [Saccharicrinis carchari]SMO50250.1 four helix bundle protein [Saccharicrinis carchari]